MRKRQIGMLCCFCAFVSLSAHAQTDRQYIREGNKRFHVGNYVEAEVLYRKAMAKNGRNAQATYNLGNSLLAQQKDSAAVTMFQNAGKLEVNKIRKSKSYHNIGVICQKHQMYAEAIEAYKESLRNNPADDETRYNLALCRRLLKNQPQNNKNKNQDKNNKDKQKDKKEQQNKDKKEEQQKQQSQQEKMRKDNAEQLLNAAMQQEKSTQQRLKKAMQQPKTKQYQNNW